MKRSSDRAEETKTMSRQSNDEIRIPRPTCKCGVEINPGEKWCAACKWEWEYLKGATQ